MKSICNVHGMYPIALVISRLKAEGIWAIPAHFYTVSMQPHLSTAFGGVEIYVKDTDVDRALDIIRAIGHFDSPRMGILKTLLFLCLFWFWGIPPSPSYIIPIGNRVEGTSNPRR